MAEKLIKLSIVTTIASVAFLAFHLFYRAVDSTALILYFAAIIPWYLSIVKSIEAPGVKVELKDDPQKLLELEQQQPKISNDSPLIDSSNVSKLQTDIVKVTELAAHYSAMSAIAFWEWAVAVDDTEKSHILLDLHRRSLEQFESALGALLATGKSNPDAITRLRSLAKELGVLERVNSDARSIELKRRQVV